MRRIWAVIAALGLALGLVTAVAGPASASTSECISGTVCIWDLNSFNDLILTVRRDPGQCYNLPGVLNDRGNSFYNHLATGKHIQLYKDVNCTGALLNSVNYGQGPFADWVNDNLVDFGQHQSTNQLSSIFFNTG